MPCKPGDGWVFWGCLGGVLGGVLGGLEGVLGGSWRESWGALGGVGGSWGVCGGSWAEEGPQERKRLRKVYSRSSPGPPRWRPSPLKSLNKGSKRDTNVLYGSILFLYDFKSFSYDFIWF